MRVRREQCIQARRARARHGVARAIRRDPPPVEHDEHDGPVRHYANARTIAANSSALSDAPPTSAPSIPSARANSAAIAPVTLPPYRIGVSRGSPIVSSARLITSAAEVACFAVAGRPVPIAQIGSYAMTSDAAL